jgi:hypothetical protein
LRDELLALSEGWDVDQAGEMTLTFRCPPALEAILPRPIAAVRGLPDWFKTMPAKAFSATTGRDTATVKKCPPFIDAMIYGFLIPLAIDLEVRDGEFKWDFDVPQGYVSEFSHSPIDFHDPGQVAARRSLRTTASSLSPIRFGPSRRRRAIHCCSPIRSIAPICRSPRSPAWSTAIRSTTVR